MSQEEPKITEPSQESPSEPAGIKTSPKKELSLDNLSTTTDSPIQQSLTIHLLYLRTSLNHLSNIKEHIPVPSKLLEAI